MVHNLYGFVNYSLSCTLTKPDFPRTSASEPLVNRRNFSSLSPTVSEKMLSRRPSKTQPSIGLLFRPTTRSPLRTFQVSLKFSHILFTGEFRFRMEYSMRSHRCHQSVKKERRNLLKKRLYYRPNASKNRTTIPKEFTLGYRAPSLGNHYYNSRQQSYNCSEEKKSLVWLKGVLLGISLLSQLNL